MNQPQDKKPAQATQTATRQEKPAGQVDMKPEPKAGQNAVAPVQKKQENNQGAQQAQAVAPLRQIELFFAQENVMARIAQHLECGQAQVYRIVRGLLQAVRTSQDDRLVTCRPESFLNCIYDAYALKLEVDARQHCYLVRYADEATLAPGYLGYLHRLETTLDGFDHRTLLIWDGDIFEKWFENDLAFYKYKPGTKQARSDYGALKEAHFYMSYYIHGEKRSHIESIDRVELDRIRSKAKSPKVWSEWMGEQVKKACIRRACKTRFKSLVADLAARDNEDYDMDDRQISRAAGGAAPEQRTGKRSHSERMRDMVQERSGEEKKPDDTEIPDAEYTEEEPDNKPAETETAAEEQHVQDVNSNAQHVQNEPAAEHNEEPAEHDHPEEDPRDREEATRPTVDWPDWIPITNQPWRGALMLGGKPVNKDFNMLQAHGYLTTVAAKRTKRGVRMALVVENADFMNQLATDGKIEMFNSLIHLVNQGAPDDDATV